MRTTLAIPVALVLMMVSGGCLTEGDANGVGGTDCTEVGCGPGLVCDAANGPPTCVPDLPGFCPQGESNECESDLDCDAGQVCQRVIDDTALCTFPCALDRDCGPGVRCRNGAPGACYGDANSKIDCEFDNECPGGRRCLYNGAGYVCAPLCQLGTECSNGRCDRLLEAPVGRCQVSQLTGAGNRCATTADCPQSLRCHRDYGNQVCAQACTRDSDCPESFCRFD